MEAEIIFQYDFIRRRDAVTVYSSLRSDQVGGRIERAWIICGDA
jgi:hypothetical protein